MTIVIADTKDQADYWIKELSIQDAKYCNRMEQIQGLHINTKIVAVGTMERWSLVSELRRAGFTVEYDARTA